MRSACRAGADPGARGPVRSSEIVEDASHAIGARYKGDYVGNGAFADITVFSFHPVKIITTAEGGMAVTNDAALAQRMALFRSHGITRDSDLDDPQSGRGPVLSADRTLVQLSSDRYSGGPWPQADGAS